MEQREAKQKKEKNKGKREESNQATTKCLSENGYSKLDPQKYKIKNKAQEEKLK